MTRLAKYTATLLLARALERCGLFVLRHTRRPNELATAALMLLVSDVIDELELNDTGAYCWGGGERWRACAPGAHRDPVTSEDVAPTMLQAMAHALGYRVEPHLGFDRKPLWFEWVTGHTRGNAYNTADEAARAACEHYAQVRS